MALNKKQKAVMSRIETARDEYNAICFVLKQTEEICTNSGKWNDDQQAHQARAFLRKLKTNYAESILEIATEL